MITHCRIGVRVGVDESASSSHDDTVGEGSDFVVTNNGDSICSISQKLSKIQFLPSIVNGVHTSE